MKNTHRFDLSAMSLHLLAMALMLCDHLWAMVIPGAQWLNSIGRLAFPIFAFLVVEGYFHTHSIRRYALRLFLFALISEIPFNLMYSGGIVYPFHQNVIWTLLCGLTLIYLNEKARKTGRLWVQILTGLGTILLGYVAGSLLMLDYYGVGVLTVLVFYFFRKRTWWCLLGQIAALYYLNVVLIGGLYFDVSLFGFTFTIVQQGFALAALIPIWLYHGRQGPHSKAFQVLCYSFYPLHMVILYLIQTLR